ncbi:MAG: hypothetical protein Q7S55_04465 [Nanoarchaeota archaeon]|nr:hypothetical protein [Nanoarchaeota archaeon]
MGFFRRWSALTMLVIFLLLIGCEQTQLQQAGSLPAVEVAEGEETDGTIPVAEQALTSCQYNSDCKDNLLCIDGSCKTLASLYKTDCDNKCTITAVSVKTSDGEKYDLGLGQGSYTAAGALEWKLLKTPDYCQGENPLVAVNLIKKTTGKVVGEQILTLHEGDTSEEVTHPTVKSVKFTATLAGVTENCS